MGLIERYTPGGNLFPDGSSTMATIVAAFNRAAANRDRVDNILRLEWAQGDAAYLDQAKTHAEQRATAASTYAVGYTNMQVSDVETRAVSTANGYTDAQVALVQAGVVTDAGIDAGIDRAVADGRVDATASDPAVAGLIQDPATATGAAAAAAATTATGVTSVDSLHTTKLIPLPGRTGLFVRNEQPKYAVKIDQYATNGVHDAVNIAANFAGAHTPFSVNSGNTTLSTVKIVNSAAQTGGVVIAAVGDNSARNAALFGADNSGTGPSYLSTVKSGNAIAFRASYDPGTYTNAILWATGHHTGGHLLAIDNDGAHTSGSMLRLAETNTSSSAPIIQVDNAGTGWSISAPNFRVLKDGRTAVSQLEGLGSFSHGTVQMKSTGVFIERSANDANPTLKIQDTSGSGTGDITQFVRRGGEVMARISSKGTLTIKTTAPANSEVENNEAAIYYDPGAGVLRVKAKNSAGTVQNGTITLS